MAAGRRRRASSADFATAVADRRGHDRGARRGERRRLLRRRVCDACVAASPAVGRPRPCNSALAQPGAALSEGKSLCGGTLGSEYVLADCTLTRGHADGRRGVEEGLQAQQRATGRKRLCPRVPTGAISPPRQTSTSASTRPPSSRRRQSSSRISRMEEARAGGHPAGLLAGGQLRGHNHVPGGPLLAPRGTPERRLGPLTKGVSFGVTFRSGAPNRMILRLSGRHVSVYLNGRGVTQANTSRVQSPGFVDFYLDNRGDPDTETVVAAAALRVRISITSLRSDSLKVQGGDD